MNESDRHQLNSRFTAALEYITAELYSSMLNEWQAQELTVLQARILHILYHQGPTRMGELAIALGHNLSSTTSLMDRLVDKDLVQRGPALNDRRVVVCQLTRKGTETLQRIRGITDANIDQIVSSASTEQMGSIVAGLEELSLHVERTKERLN